MEDAELPVPGAPAGRPTRRFLASAAGFTLVELMVTLAVIAIGVVATHRVFLETLDATASASARTHASAIASREVEEVQAIPYDQVGLPSGSPASFEGAQTVIASGSTIPHTGPPETIDGVVFSITRWILWEQGTSTHTKAIKRVVAIVGWDDEAGHHDVRADAAVYPGGLGPYGGSGTTTTTTASTPGVPTALAATVSPINPQNQIDLTWAQGVPAPSFWEIQLSSDPSLADTSWIVVTDNHPGSVLSYGVTGLAAETTYTFRVRAINPDVTPSGWSNLATASTVQLEGECEVQSAAADPASVRKKTNPGTLSSDIWLTVNTLNVGGACGTLQGFFETSPGNTKSVVFVEGWGTDVYRHRIWKNDYTDWAVGNKVIRVKNSAGVEIAQISLVVTN